MEEAIKRGYDINVLLRDEGKLMVRSAAIKIFTGNPADAGDLTKAMQGCGAVLSALNISRTSDFPWAPLRTPRNFLSLVMGHIINVAEQLKIKRVIITSAWGVNETKKDLPWWFSWIIDHSNISYAYKDHEIQEDQLKNSALNWTAVRPVGLTNTLNHKAVAVSFNNIPKPRLTISRQNTARFMLDILKNDLYVKQTPTIFEK